MAVGLCALILAVCAGVSGSAAQAAVPSTGAEAACMIDADTGTILYQVNPTKWMHPASTTKIVTLITALDQKEDELDQPLKISSYAANTEPSSLGIAPGDKLSVREALRGMMVVSGNDAAVAVAETLGGSVAGYADMMKHAFRQSSRPDGGEALHDGRRHGEDGRLRHEEIPGISPHRRPYVVRRAVSGRPDAKARHDDKPLFDQWV